MQVHIADGKLLRAPIQPLIAKRDAGHRVYFPEPGVPMLPWNFHRSMFPCVRMKDGLVLSDALEIDRMRCSRADFMPRGDSQCGTDELIRGSQCTRRETQSARKGGVLVRARDKCSN